jgi:hypothetical protein
VLCDDDDAFDAAEPVARFFAGARFGEAAPPPRLSLLRPGRERGRLPRTPGSSSRFGGTTGENTGRSGVMARAPPKPRSDPGTSDNVGAVRRVQPVSRFRTYYKCGFGVYGSGTMGGPAYCEEIR